MTDDQAIAQPHLVARLIIGLAQGLALYLLYYASDNHLWPATSGLVFAPLLLIWLYIPLLASLALGGMSWRAAALWTLIAATILGGLSFYDNWSAWPVNWGYGLHPTPQPHILNSAIFYFVGGLSLFVAHALVMGGYADRRFMARYPRHFDVAWKLAVQLALAAVFVGAFWLLLWLGAGLFELIKLDFFRNLIRHEWFSIPVTALAVAGALYLTDVRPALVRGARTLLLTLLSWLLPLITLIVAGFLASLFFTGLAPLWSIGHAAALLFVACAVLILLINAAHQDGDAERLPPRILRLLGTLAAVLPVPLSLIAAYALFLRVQQYGWTVERVYLAAGIVIACSYAAGYLLAAIKPGPWLKTIERWNFCVALLILAIMVALFTPIASPARISVSDQMARLAAGQIAPEKFDFDYLRWNGGRYGQQALQQLLSDHRAFVRQSAHDALKMQYQYLHPRLPPAESAAQRITVYPKGMALPADFLRTDWSQDLSSGEQPKCMTSVNFRCDAVLADLDGDGQEEIILIPHGQEVTNAVIFRHVAGKWRLEGLLDFYNGCGALIGDLREGRFTTAPPEHVWKDIRVGNARLHIKDSIGLSSGSCPTPSKH